MDESCKNCIHATTMDERMKRLEVKVEICDDSFNQRIHAIETKIAVTDERLKSIEQKLNEVILMLKQNSDRLPNFVWGVAGAILAGVVMWLIK